MRKTHWNVNIMPNTHRRRRRDSKVAETEHVENLSCRFEYCRRCVRAYVGCRDPVYNSAANAVGLEVAGSWLKTAASWLRSHRRHDADRHDAARLCCRQTVQTRRDCRQLVANSTHRRCVLGITKWHRSQSNCRLMTGPLVRCGTRLLRVRLHLCIALYNRQLVDGAAWRVHVPDGDRFSSTVSLTTSTWWRNHCRLVSSIAWIRWHDYIRSETCRQPTVRNNTCIHQ